MLECIEELDRDSNIQSPASLKSAYCAVASECTVKHLRRTDGEHHRFFTEAVQRIWNCRISDLKVSEAAPGLFSPQLQQTWRLMDDAIGNLEVRGQMLQSEEDTKKKALDSLRLYLEDAFNQLGPPFLEVKASKFLSRSEECRATVASAAAYPCPQLGKKEKIPPSEEVVAHREIKSIAEKIVSSSNTALHDKQHEYISSYEVLKAKKALKLSCANLHDAVDDPLPRAIEMATELLSSVAVLDNSPHDHGRASVVDTAGPSNLAANAEENHVGNLADRVNRDEITKRSLMERNPTARTCEWDDSIEFSAEESPDALGKLRVPTSQKRRQCPTNLPRIAKCARRRVIKKWSVLEEDTLREAVEKHGKGNWKFISIFYRSVFQDRTTVDLKDKWRNMNR